LRLNIRTRSIRRRVAAAEGTLWVDRRNFARAFADDFPSGDRVGDCVCDHGFGIEVGADVGVDADSGLGTVDEEIDRNAFQRERRVDSQNKSRGF
jgi:hypothetical protein